MILVREVFQLKFGAARDAVEALKEGLRFEDEMGGSRSRLLTDLVGPYYTLVMESTYESLAAFEEAGRKLATADEWRAWYRDRFVPLVESGRREIFQIVG